MSSVSMRAGRDTTGTQSHPAARVYAANMASARKSQWKTFQRFRREPGRSTGLRGSSGSVQNSQAVLRELQQAVKITANVIAAAAPQPARRDHRGPAGDQHQLPHRAAGPQAGLRPGPGRPGRSRRDRLDVGGLRGRSHPRQRPTGPRRGPRPQRPARADGVQPGAPRRRPGLGRDRRWRLGITRAGRAGCDWTGCSTCPRRASAARARFWNARSSTWWPRGCAPSPGASRSSPNVSRRKRADSRLRHARRKGDQPCVM